MEAYEVITKDGAAVELSMQELWLTGELLPVGARLVARHVFESAEDEPLEVIYSFMLPRDAALRQFRIEGEGFSVRSELKPVPDAEEVYENAMRDGYLAGMTRGYRDGVTHLMVGNLQPGKRVTVYLDLLTGVEANDDGFRFRFPFALAPSYHPQARTVVTGPGEGEMELPRETFGDVILPPYRDDPSALHRVGFELNVPVPGGAASVQSPSHTLNVDIEDASACRVALAREADVPNRDLVIDVTLAERKPLVYTGALPDGGAALAAWIPSLVFGDVTRQPGRTVFVLDRSGSMEGAPMAQAKKALLACLGAMNPDDAFTVIAFDDRVETMPSGMVHGDREGRDQADQFLQSIDARGGTEIQAALLAAADVIRESGGDLFLLTDGQVFETEAIINRIAVLGVRVHVLGIGSASQDRFLSQLARQTGGTCRFITPQERVDRAAMELFASISGPVASDLAVRIEGEGGTVQPAPAQTVYAGTPVTVYGEAASIDALALTWSREGRIEELRVTDRVEQEEATTLRLLRGARLITDLEARIESPGGSGAVARREAKRRDSRLEDLSREYGLASRAMSLVAVVEAEQDTSGALARTKVVPVGMPEDTRFGAYFAAPAESMALMDIEAEDMATASYAGPVAKNLQCRLRTSRLAGVVAGLAARFDSSGDMETEAPLTEDDLLIELAARLEPDGGMPGDDDESRLVASLFALLCFVSQGSTADAGPFRRHLERLVAYLEQAIPLPDLPAPPADMVDAIVQARPDYPDWEATARTLLSEKQTLTPTDWSRTYTEAVR